MRGGGHNPAGHCMLDGGLVIDLSLLRAVEVDEDAQTARAQGGSTWLDFDSATQAVGLVTPGGVVGSTGVCGLTLGGGIGHLTAQYGLTCDNLMGAELVSPDGSVIRASSDENAELLWGLRGGGGNFGVVTQLEFRLERLDRVVGGLLDFRGSASRRQFPPLPRPRRRLSARPQLPGDCVRGRVAGARACRGPLLHGHRRGSWRATGAALVARARERRCPFSDVPRSAARVRLAVR